MWNGLQIVEHVRRAPEAQSLADLRQLRLVAVLPALEARYGAAAQRRKYADLFGSV